MSDRGHLRRSEVVDLKAETLPPERMRLVVAHLARGCPVCTDNLEEGIAGLRRANARRTERSYGRAVERALTKAAELARTIAAELARGRAVWDGLRKLPAGRRLTLVQSSRRHSTAAVLQVILEALRGAMWQEPAEVLEHAVLAATIARRLDEETALPWLVADLQAEALAMAGNAHSVMARFDEAESLLAEASRRARRGSCDPLVEAVVLGYQGAHQLARRQFRTAERFLARAERLYRRVGQLHPAARMLVQRAGAIGHLHPEQGVRLTRRALEEMEVEFEPGLELEAVHQLAWCLCDAGQPLEARSEVESSGELYLRFGALASFSRSWLLGRIHRALDEFEDAERLFGRAWVGFLEIGARLPLAMLAIDVAEIRVAVGNPGGAAAQLAELLVLARGWGVRSESLAILGVLRREIAAGGCDRVAFRRAALALRRAWD
jgi:tetratricopeptide (TPR) repeat protein